MKQVGATSAFVIQLDAFMTGVSVGNAAFVQAKAEAAAEEFFKRYFKNMPGYLDSLSETLQSHGGDSNAFGFNYSNPLTYRWIVKKNPSLRFIKKSSALAADKKKNPGDKSYKPKLWRGLTVQGSLVRQKLKLSDQLKGLARNSENASKKMVSALGGVNLKTVTGGGALRPSVSVGADGRPRNTKSGKRVNWVDAVRPEVNAYLNKTDLSKEPRLTQTGKGIVEIKGAKGNFSVQRALYRGAFSVLGNISFLDKLDKMGPGRTDFDYIQTLKSAKLINRAMVGKLKGLKYYGHDYPEMMLGYYLAGNDRNTDLTEILKEMLNG